MLATKHLDHAKEAAAKVGPRVQAVPLADVDGDIAVAATPYDQQVSALRSLRNISGKTIVEISNPLKPDFSGLAVGHSTSAGEEIAKALQGAKIVKAFNTIFAQVLSENPTFGGGRRASVFYAGDDDPSKQKVRTLIESMGFEAVDADRFTMHATWNRSGCSTSGSATWQSTGPKSRRLGFHAPVRKVGGQGRAIRRRRKCPS